MNHAVALPLSVGIYAVGAIALFILMGGFSPWKRGLRLQVGAEIGCVVLWPVTAIVLIILWIASLRK